MSTKRQGPNLQGRSYVVSVLPTSQFPHGMQNQRTQREGISHICKLHPLLILSQATRTWLSARTAPVTYNLLVSTYLDSQVRKSELLGPVKFTRLSILIGHYIWDKVSKIYFSPSVLARYQIHARSGRACAVPLQVRLSVRQLLLWVLRDISRDIQIDAMTNVQVLL